MYHVGGGGLAVEWCLVAGKCLVVGVLWREGGDRQQFLVIGGGWWI